jgi:hypothetical protein
MDPKLATWEDSESLRQQFSAAPAWGQVGSQARGNISVTDTGGKEVLGLESQGANELQQG